ncbi:MAG: TolB family protein, partial [Candidatus Angelobacter sp.]
MNLAQIIATLALTWIAATPLIAQPAVLTDPAQITSKQKFDIQPFSVEKLYMTHNTGASTWSPDGKQIAFVSNISGRNNIWVVSAQSGWPTQLTVSNQSQTSPAWSPTGRWIAYMSDTDGNEQFDIFLVAPSNGQVINLTNTPGISEGGMAWSLDGERLAYIVKAKDGANWEIEVIEILTKKVTHVTMNTPKNLRNYVAAWSRDGKSLVFNQKDAAGKDGNIFIANVSSGQTTNLTPHQGEQNFSATDISPDSKTVLITSNSGNAYNNAALLDVATRKISWLTSEKWEVT